MADCKQCLHYEICEYVSILGKTCKDFKDRTKWAEKKKPATNADRIRAMSDEELAEFLNRVKEPCDYCQLAVVDGACTETLCDDAMMKWLKQPAEGD